MYSLRVSRPAQKDLDRLQGSSWERIHESLTNLRADPRPPGCKKLRGGVDTFRIRVGDYRMIYDVDDEARMVLILRVKHRREVFR